MGMTPAPPLPPDVNRQMAGSPADGFVDGAMQADSQPSGMADPSKIAEGLLQEIVERLAKVAQIYQEEQPQVIPIIKKMAEMGSRLVNIVNSSKKGRGTASGGNGLGPGQAPEGPQSMPM
jgi:hypothetical protein